MLCASVLVIFLSYPNDFLRVGAIIMVLLDPADVPLHVGKMLKYISDTHGNGPMRSASAMLADLCLVVFVIVFSSTRCVLYPYTVWSTAVESNQVRYPHLPWAEAIKAPGGLACGVCCVLLINHMVLQFFWMWLLIKVVWRTVTKGELGDVRSDDEEEEEGEEDKKKLS
jgi:ceramide synthetase